MPESKVTAFSNLIYFLLFFVFGCNVSGPGKIMIKGSRLDMAAEEATSKALESGQTVTISDKIEWFSAPSYSFNLKTKEFTNPARFSLIEYVPQKILKFTERADGIHTREINLEKEWYCIEIDELIAVRIKEGKVVKMEFPCMVFDACDMPQDKFAQTLIDNYNIPQLEPEGMDYIYHSDKGYKVEVEANWVRVEKTVSANESKFD